MHWDPSELWTAVRWPDDHPASVSPAFPVLAAWMAKKEHKLAVLYGE